MRKYVVSLRIRHTNSSVLYYTSSIVLLFTSVKRAKLYADKKNGTGLMWMDLPVVPAKRSCPKTAWKWARNSNDTIVFSITTIPVR